VWSVAHVAACSVLSVPLDEVVTPGLMIKVAGEGLPLTAQGTALKVRTLTELWHGLLDM
jgi:hypothetical protein